ncbi:hypothetical protein LP419_16640 [Massilia sp. H-1]|nr:hypothetical protein LP419_16640 [Massilia sp. H-1]
MIDQRSIDLPTGTLALSVADSAFPARRAARLRRAPTTSAAFCSCPRSWASTGRSRQP